MMASYDMRRTIEQFQEAGFELKTIRKIIWILAFSTVMSFNVIGIITISLISKALSYFFADVSLSQISFNTGVLFTTYSLYIIPRVVKFIHIILGK